MIKNIIDTLEHVPPDMLKKILNGCLWEGTSDSDTLALTFDDGPDPEVTPKLDGGTYSNGVLVSGAVLIYDGGQYSNGALIPYPSYPSLINGGTY